MRRLWFVLVATLLLFPMTVVSALSAQDATPTSGLADLGLPTLDVTVTSTGFDGIPETLEAGRYLVNVTAGEDTGDFGGGVSFVQPTGMSVDEYLSLMMSGPPDETGEGAAASTPMAGMDATPTDGDAGEDVSGGMEGPPAALFEAVFAGGTFAFPGQTAHVVLDLGPGEWFAWADNPEAPQEPVIFDVTGEMPAELIEPESAATLTMGEYVIEVTEGELTAGTRILKIENVGAQPHFLFSALGPDDMTAEQIGVALEEEAAAEMTGTPTAYSDFNPDEDLSFESSFNTATQSTATAQWIVVDLQPGMYVIACFFPDIADGMPHAYKGMYTVVEVAE